MLSVIVGVNFRGLTNERFRVVVVIVIIRPLDDGQSRPGSNVINCVCFSVCLSVGNLT